MKQAAGKLDYSPSQAVDLQGNAIAILFFLLVSGVLLFRLLMTSPLMNMVVPYTSEGGAFYAKFHLGTYLIIALLSVSLFTRRISLRGDDIALFRFLILHAGLLAGLMIYVIAISRIGATGILVDTYLAACLVAILMMTLPHHGRRLLGTLFVIVLTASALLAIGEAVVQRRLMPFTESEPYFRATGLTGHPLSLGAYCVLAIGFALLTRWPIWVRLVTVALIFFGCVASGARTALVLASLEIVLLLFLVRWPKLSERDERKAKRLAFLVAAVMGGVLFAGLLAGGFLSRFQGASTDGNFMARIDIYRIFGFVSWKDIMLGMSPQMLLETVREKLRLPYIESAPVLIVLQAGLPAAIVLTVIVIRLILRLLHGAAMPAKIATAVFLIGELSNNALATKNGDVILLFVLIMAFRARPGEIAAPRQGLLSMVSSRPLRVRV
ncbi:hypothetical protein GAO09_03225 [Rhizobiales bacterium RZME27]|uniref:Uncharacterized protein n=1 Tax=Endobacterium cereale TaxID=2663029 RepID=A0A6A8A8G5_9HYPH|nr:VpsF family polysaccharide biosynthesis protein [Endobacterium cereale]MEB2844604.1 VpsF family polysaccharide biosynthesis protein [Endobacterium cereale]MQY45081.1 hypothetical protein [Endobacterium cereale]